MKGAKLKKDEYALIASNLKNGNDLVDKHFADSHQIKSIYFNDEDEYAESFNLNQHEHYSTIIEKLKDTEESITIHQNLEQMYYQYITEYSILQKCKYVLHTVKFKSGVKINKNGI